MWVRGLKHDPNFVDAVEKRSHPMWVRGLKHGVGHPNVPLDGRTLCGCVD